MKFSDTCQTRLTKYSQPPPNRTFETSIFKTLCNLTRICLKFVSTQQQKGKSNFAYLSFSNLAQKENVLTLSIQNFKKKEKFRILLKHKKKCLNLGNFLQVKIPKIRNEVQFSPALAKTINKALEECIQLKSTKMSQG